MTARTRFSILFYAALLFAAAFAPARAEVIDRIAVSVGNQVITADQVNEEIRVTAFLNHDKPDLSPAEKKKTAERLIEQTLVKREMDLSRYPLPEMTDADPPLEALRAAYPGAAEFQRALRDAGVGEEDLKRHLWWQLTLLRFIDFRFRPGVQVAEADVKAYYDEQARKDRERGVRPIPSLDESREKIERILEQQRADEALDRWLGDTRTQVEIRYHAGALD